MTVRVGIVCPNYAAGLYGGVEAVASWLRDAVCAEPGFDAEIISIATSRRDEVSTRLGSPATWARRPSSAWHEVGGVPVEHFGCWLAEVEPARYLPRPALTRRLRSFDIVQVVSGTPAFGNVATRAGRPVCLQVATTVESERRHEAGHRSDARPHLIGAVRAAVTSAVARLERRAVRRADHTFVENEWMLDQVRSLVGDATVTLAPPGVDEHRFAPGSVVTGQGYLLTVGRLGSERKNLPGLLRSYAAARRNGHLSLPMVVAGGGALSPAAADVMSELGLSEHVRVVADPSADRLLDLYQGASTFVLASHEEGLGVVLLEAQSCGVPIVSTSTAGAAEVFRRGAIGQLVDTFQGTSTALGEAMGTWARRGVDPTVQETCRAFATREFGTAVTAGRYLERYRALLR
ncbi:hypothetical protein GCM10023340_20170 [Nocardioides marinquilinus]|uniref:Glycosyltransferase n=1 Tax=Nocardioides marinquilinus TaxID=1210400 RepID=A0ABP9PMI3_9ACTN